MKVSIIATAISVLSFSKLSFAEQGNTLPLFFFISVGLSFSLFGLVLSGYSLYKLSKKNKELNVNVVCVLNKFNENLKQGKK